MIAINSTSDLLNELEGISRLSVQSRKPMANDKSNKKKATSEHSFLYPVLKVFVGLTFGIRKGFFLYLRSSRLLKSLEFQMTKEYEIFSKSDERGKEDIIIKWERVSKKVNTQMKSTPDYIPLSLKGTFSLLRKIVFRINEYTNELKEGFYGDLNKPLSQEYLKELSSKFSHLPKDVLDNLASDKYSEYL
jgi:hypothetical protein